MTARLVVIGGSAGATDALRALLPALGTPDVPIVLVLHRHPHSPTGLDELVGSFAELPVHDTEEKTVLMPGQLYLAPANYHLLVERTGTASLCAGPRVQFARPSIDVTFESATDAFGADVIGVVLSGGNRDGVAGARRISAGGGVVLVQSPESAEVETMPRAVLEHAGADHIAPPDALGTLLAELCRRAGEAVTS